MAVLEKSILDGLSSIQVLISRTLLRFCFCNAKSNNFRGPGACLLYAVIVSLSLCVCDSHATDALSKHAPVYTSE